MSKLPSKELQRTYLKLHGRAARRHKHPGRNIVLDGVLTGSGRVRLAGRREVARSVRVLRGKLGGQPAAGIPAGTKAKLQSIAACESHGDPSAVGGGGAYRGKYQFDVGTWQSVGGKGDPASAPESEQDKRAAMLLQRDGAGHWPVCG